MKFYEIGEKQETALDKQDILYADIDSSPFRVLGVFFGNDGRYHRMPADIADAVSPSVKMLSAHTAGGRIEFVTNSTYIAVKAKLGNYGHMYHFSALGNYGFDVYDGKELKGIIWPGIDRPSGYERIVELGEGEHNITVNMPLYSEVCEVKIGLSKDAEISHAPLYRYEKPVVFYGSSITQGGCASRPGMSYQSILSRELDFNYINLGFSGSAKAEDAIIEYISGLDMSVFVYDYDYNAPTDEHYEKTHEKMFLAIRAAHPDMPIIMMSRPGADAKERIAVINRTYQNAAARGDKNVYLLPGAGLNQFGGTVDGCHPNDLGFYLMAEALLPVLKKALEDSEK